MADVIAMCCFDPGEITREFVGFKRMYLTEFCQHGQIATRARADFQYFGVSRQGQFLAFIREYMLRNYAGVAPTHADLQRYFKRSAPSVNSISPSRWGT